MTIQQCPILPNSPTLQGELPKITDAPQHSFLIYIYRSHYISHLSHYYTTQDPSELNIKVIYKEKKKVGAGGQTDLLISKKIYKNKTLVLQ